MYELKYTNDRNQVIDFGKSGYSFSDTNENIDNIKNSFSVIGFEGFGETQADVQTQKSPYQDGETNIDSVLEMKHPYLEFYIKADNYEQLASLRRYANSTFNPKSAGVLELTIKDKVYLLNVVPEHVPNYSIGSADAMGTMQISSINFVAPSPYWRSPNQTTQPLLAYKGKFTLPMTFPFELGVAGSRTTLYNDGDVEAPVRIEINGPTTNPNIINRTTGENIKINRTIAEGETMYINTEQGRQRIVVVDENGGESNAFGYLDHNSTLFYLWLGENSIEHVADAGNRHAEVIINWDSMYAGV